MSAKKVAAMTVSAEGRVVLANQAARDRFPGCVGRRCVDVVRFRDANGAAVCSSACWTEIAGDEGIRDVEGRTGGGGPARLVCAAMEDRDGHPIGSVVVIPTRPPVVGDAVALSNREAEIVHWMLRGKSGPQIARQLGIKPSTVRTHVDHVKDKLGVRKNTEVVSRALALGLGEPP